MDDAALGVPALAGEVEAAGGVAVELHVQFVEQELLHCSRTLADQLVDGLGVCGAVAGRENVLRQPDRIVARVVDDAALGPVAVGAQWFAEGKQLHLETGARRMPGVGGAGETGTEDEAVRVDDSHQPCRSRLRSAAATE